jgi:Arc/MetJ-type ribon-helix-helix transcriptional regulator
MAEDEPNSETVTVEVPARILKDLRSLVDAGLFLSLDEALRESLLSSWRYLRASYHRIRIDQGDPAEDEDGQPEV